MQQNGSAVQTAFAQGLHVSASATPSVQMEWAQLHWVLHSVFARSTHACVQLSVQHVGSTPQTAVMHASAPHVV